MMRAALSILLVLLCGRGHGQDRAVIDSLNRVLGSTRVDTVKVSTLIELAGHHYVTDADKAIAFCEQAREISERTASRYKMGDVLGWLAYLYEQQGLIDRAIDLNQQALQYAQQAGDRSDESTILVNLAAIYSNQGRLDEALMYNKRSLALKLESGQRQELATTYNNIGLIYLNQGKVVEALEYYTLSLRIEEEFKNLDGIAVSLENIAHVYKAQKEYGPAFENTRKSLSIRLQLKDRYGEGYSLNTLGGLHQAQGRSDSALYYFQRSYAIREQLKDRQGMAYSMKNIGGIYEQLKQPGQALEFFGKSLSIFEELNDKWGMASVTCRLGGLLLHEGDLNGAEAQLNRSLRLARELGYPADIRNAAGHLQQLHRKRNDWRKALEMTDLYVQMRDSVENDENRREAVRTQYRYEYEKKEAVLKAEQEQKDALAREQLRRKDLQRNASIAGLGLMLLLAVVFLVQRNRIAKERRRSDELLLNILPDEVAEELKQKGEAEARLMEHVTVLFTDFKGFTAMSEQVTPKELVRDLHACFTAFDRICERHGIEKIKTIGDAYMAAGGLPTPCYDHAQRVVRAALEMAAVVAQGKAEKTAQGRPYFEIRIGIHSGPVVAGIVGVKKFQYDIWGDTVNTASRMESSGEVGRVNISEATYALVKNDFQCAYRGEIEAKGKGRMGMWFVSDAAP